MTDAKLDAVHRALDEGRDIEALGLDHELLGEARALARVDGWLAELAGDALSEDALSEDAARAIAARIEQRLDEPLSPLPHDPLAAPSFEGLGAEDEPPLEPTVAEDARSGEYALETLAAGVQRSASRRGVEAVAAATPAASGPTPAPTIADASIDHASGASSAGHASGASSGASGASSARASGASSATGNPGRGTSGAPQIANATPRPATRESSSRGVWLAAAAMLGLVGVGAFAWQSAAPDESAAVSRAESAAPMGGMWDEPANVESGSVADEAPMPSAAPAAMEPPEAMAQPALEEASAEEAAEGAADGEREAEREERDDRFAVSQRGRATNERVAGEQGGGGGANGLGATTATAPARDPSSELARAAPRRSVASRPPSSMAAASPWAPPMTAGSSAVTGDLERSAGSVQRAPSSFVRRSRVAVLRCLGDEAAVTLRLGVSGGRVARIVSSSPASVLARPGARTCMDAALRGRDLEGEGTFEARYER